MNSTVQVGLEKESTAANAQVGLEKESTAANAQVGLDKLSQYNHVVSMYFKMSEMVGG